MSKTHFDTLAIHAGGDADPTTGARTTPIYQTACYEFKNAAHAADLFALRDTGYVYSRLTNPTVSALGERITALEGGVGTVCTASGHAGQLLALYNLLQSGDEFVASKRLYGGTYNQFNNSFKQFGWKVKFVDADNLNEVKAAITPKTKCIYAETIANPAGVVIDIEALAKIAHDAGIPLLVDNTIASPYLCRPIEYGADIVLNSTTKFLAGHGSTMGGAVTDAGNFDWSQNDKFPLLTEPDPAYNGLKYHETFGKMAFFIRSIALGLRDLGMMQTPMNAFLTMTGMETLPLRMQKHTDNALKVAKFLEKHPKVEWVSYAGLDSSPYKKLVKKYMPNGAGAVFTCGVTGGYAGGKGVVENAELFSHVANIGDTRSLIIHPASTTHSQLSSEERTKIGIHDNAVRLSIGIEHADDIIADLDQALAKI